jgi:hypothetical protein
MDDPIAVEARGILKPEGEDRWVQYRRTAVVEMRPYEPGEDTADIQMPPGVTPREGDYVARDPANREDQWLVSAMGVQHEFKRI